MSTRDDGSPHGGRVVLREERSPGDGLYVSARLDASGELRIEGKDVGSLFDPLLGDAEFTWHHIVAAENIPRLLALLGEEPDADVLVALRSRWSGPRAAEVESVIRDSDVGSEFAIWGKDAAPY